MDASITLNCSAYSDDIRDVIKVFNQIGWNTYTSNGEVEYLPVGDNDMYDWKCEILSEKELYNIISRKIEKKEMIGVGLFYADGSEGVSFLAQDTDNILLHILTNRRIIIGRNTDMAWYVENIIYKLLNFGVRLLSYEFEEYED